MAQIFPPVSMAGLGMALADVALAKQLVAVLAGLEGPCGALRNQLAVPAEGPPWVRYVLFHGERGIALLDFAPAHPSRGIKPLKAFLAEEGFAGRYRGELPVVAVELSPETILDVGTLIAEAFAAAPPCTIRDAGWCEAVNRLLMTAEGLTMARVMPAQRVASPGPVRLAQARQNTAAVGNSQIPLVRKSALERPFLQIPIREKPILAKALPAQPASRRPKSRPVIGVDPAKRRRSWISEKYPHAISVFAGISVAALAVAALPYFLSSLPPPTAAPAAVSLSSEESVVPRSVVVADAAPLISTVATPPDSLNPSSGAVAETVPPTTAAAPMEADAATESGDAAPPDLVDGSGTGPPSDETAAALAPPPVAMERNTELPSSGSEPVASSSAAGKPPVRERPLGTAAPILPARSTAKRAPIWLGAPMRAAARAPLQEFVVATRTRDTR